MSESETQRHDDTTGGAAAARVITPPVAGGLAARLLNEIRPDEELRTERRDDEEQERRETRTPFFAMPLSPPDRLSSPAGEEDDPWATPSTSRAPKRRPGDGDSEEASPIDARWLRPEEDDGETRAGVVSTMPLAARPPDSMITPKATGQHKNRRVVVAAGLAVVLILAFMVSNRKNAPDTSKEDKTQATMKSQGQPTMQFTSPGDSELGTPNRSGAPFPQQAAPVAVQPAAPPPEPPKPVAPQPLAEKPPDEPRFAVVMRAGDQSAKESEADARLKGAQKRAVGQTGGRAGSGNDERFQRGTRITLQLAEPLRSGIASVVTAQVLTDVVGKDNEVIIPAGSKAAIPFYAGENQGRMLNIVNEPAVFITPTGDEITLYGTVKGSDGFTGVTGKVIKVGGPSGVRRVLGGTARIGERVAGRVIGGAGAAGDVGQEGIYEVDRATGGFTGQLFQNSNRIVEVPTGAAITYELLWKTPNGR